ncbi:hemerythrin domain-containing protein [Kitasatospora sp. NPDC008115]|uniref:hemerythrin domain-containing protein n=1 Tax=Kitasatospora sp. NPDC008115 TaxID=3364022 RepID=UPI0036E11204
MNGPEGLLCELSSAHRAVEALLRRLDAVHARGEHAVADGRRLLAEPDRVLDEHLTVEEAHFHPLVRRYLPAGRALAGATAHTHTTVRRLLARATDERLPAADRTRCTGALLVLLRAHPGRREPAPAPADPRRRPGGRAAALRRPARRGPARTARLPRRGAAARHRGDRLRARPHHRARQREPAAFAVTGGDPRWTVRQSP